MRQGIVILDLHRTPPRKPNSKAQLVMFRLLLQNVEDPLHVPRKVSQCPQLEKLLEDRECERIFIDHRCPGLLHSSQRIDASRETANLHPRVGVQ